MFQNVCSPKNPRCVRLLRRKSTLRSFKITFWRVFDQNFIFSVAKLQNYFFYCHRVSKSRFNASRSSKITTLTTSRSILDAKQHSEHLKNAFRTPPSSTLKPCQSSNYPRNAPESIHCTGAEDSAPPADRFEPTPAPRPRRGDNYFGLPSCS